MLGLRTFLRPMLAGIFVAGGLDSLRDPEPKEPAAEGAGRPIAEAVGLPTQPATLVKINGAVQLGAGALLAMGLVPRVASLSLAGSLVPTTLGAHRFWDLPDGDERDVQLLHFLKNAGLFAGLIFSALDTGGRPSVFWAGRRAVASAASEAADVSHRVVDKVVPGDH